jgi:hypothetical protein
MKKKWQYYGAPREVASRLADGRETMRMRTMLSLNTSGFTYTDPLPSHPRVVRFFDTETDSGTDTEDVESFMPNFVSLFCR